jgi:hypothetical protein
MAEPVLWPLDDHTRAKHRVLRAYLDAWLPVTGQQAAKFAGHSSDRPRLLLVDGFAPAGALRNGRAGAPAERPQPHHPTTTRRRDLTQAPVQISSSASA